MTQASLYDITGDIKHINTLLVPKQVLDAAEKDAARYRWLTDDHADHETRLIASTIGQYISLRGKGATDVAIDASINN